MTNFDISCFCRYVSVLVELSQLEGGGGRHGGALSSKHSPDSLEGFTH
mgnify:CR=1 FL=1